MEIEVHAGWGNTDKIAVAGRSDTAVKENSLEPVRPTYDWSEAKFGDQDLDFGEVKDQQRVKRAEESPPPGGAQYSHHWTYAVLEAMRRVIPSLALSDGQFVCDAFELLSNVRRKSR